MSKQIKTPHRVELSNGQKFDTQAHVVSENRYFNGVDYLYFETFNEETPEVDGSNHYHTWTGFEPLSLHGWLVPTDQVKSITPMD